MIDNARSDDGSDKYIVSEKLAEGAVLTGIGRMANIDQVAIQVARKYGDAAQSFTFSRVWTLPRTILKLCPVPLALVNVSFLVVDADITAEDLLVGFPTLRHIGVDTKTFLEEKGDVLDGADC